MAFDICRQLAWEHLVPRAEAYGPPLHERIAAVFPGLPAEMQQKLCHRVEAMNEVTSCTSCNALAQKELTEGTTEAFRNHLIAPLPQVVSLDTPEVWAWLEGLERIITDAWKEKAWEVWGKIVRMRVLFRRAKLDAALNVALPDSRMSVSPGFLDERFRYILRRETNRPFGT